MPNLAQVMKEEITRLSRKEVKQAVSKLQKDNVWLKKNLAELRRRFQLLERNLRLQQTEVARKMDVAVDVPPPDELKKMRVTGQMVRKLRERLKVSQADLGKLLNVSGQSVYQWERKDDRLRLREETKLALQRVRKLSIKQALEELAGEGEVKPKRRGRKPAAEKVGNAKDASATKKTVKRKRRKKAQVVEAKASE